MRTKSNAANGERGNQYGSIQNGKNRGLYNHVKLSFQGQAAVYESERSVVYDVELLGRLAVFIKRTRGYQQRRVDRNPGNSAGVGR